jgi:hypothetical protein
MLTRKVVTQSTDGRFIGQEVTVSGGEANIGDFAFEVTKQEGSRIIGPNYSVNYVEE